MIKFSSVPKVSSLERNAPKDLLTLVIASLHRNRFFHSSQYLLGYQLRGNVKDCYSVLRVSPESDNYDVREAYLKLAKEYHPDSGSSVADARKFAQVEEAYRTIQEHRKGQQKLEDLDARTRELKFETDHKAPQHRKYLSYEGRGIGTMYQREKQYQQHRVQKASDTVYEYRTEKIAAQYENALVTKDRRATRKRTIRSAMDRLVDDLIAESMAKGDFDNLPGKGKPLNYSNHNPLVDISTYNLNKVLINNGYAPEWVTLEKDIRTAMNVAKGNLMDLRINLGPEPLTPMKKDRWDENVRDFKDTVSFVNKKIDKLNLVVPLLSQQMMQYNAEKEILKVRDKFKEMEKSGELEKIQEQKQREIYESQMSRGSAEAYSPVKFSDLWKEVIAIFKTN